MNPHNKKRVIISTSGREKSAKRYRKLIESLNLQDELCYETYESSDPHDTIIDPMKFVDTIRNTNLRGMPCIGAAISKDIKAAIIPLLDELDHSATVVNSCNTVIHKDGKLIGFNTDYLGFIAAIEPVINTTHGTNVASAIIYGYGGVTLCVVSALKALGLASSSIYITGRNLEKAQIRARELDVSIWQYGTVADLFINASPVTDRPLEEADNFLQALCPPPHPIPIPMPSSSNSSSNSSSISSSNISTTAAAAATSSDVNQHKQQQQQQQQHLRAVFDHEMPGKYLQDWVALQEQTHYLSGLNMYYPQMKRQWQLFLHAHTREQEVGRALDVIIRTEQEQQSEQPPSRERERERESKEQTEQECSVTSQEYQ